MKQGTLLQREDAGASNWFYCLLFVLATVFLFMLFAAYSLADRYFVVEVVGTSMQDTLMSGDCLYADYRKEPERGEIVIIDVSANPAFRLEEQSSIIKRVIAVGGDRVKCENGTVYLAVAGGEYVPLDEPYVKGVDRMEFETEVEEGRIFVMGDNRLVSNDSRYVGTFSADDVIGVVPAWSLECRGTTGYLQGFGNFFLGWFMNVRDRIYQ